MIINSQYILTSLHCVVKNVTVNIKNMMTYATDTKEDALVLIGADNPNKMRRRIKKGENL